MIMATYIQTFLIGAAAVTWPAVCSSAKLTFGGVRVHWRHDFSKPLRARRWQVLVTWHRQHLVQNR